jgi:hypothetical protein
MTHWRLLATILLCIVFLGCRKSSDQGTPKSFSDFAHQLPLLDSGFTYLPNLEDDERAYHPTDADSAFWPDRWPILGMLSDTSPYYLIISLYPGDDLIPKLIVLSPEGIRLDSVVLGHNWCPGWDCSVDSCYSMLEVVADYAVRTVDILQSTECDAQGRKLAGPSERMHWEDLVKVGTQGHIKTKEILRESKQIHKGTESLPVEWEGGFYMGGTKPGLTYWQKLDLRPEGDSIAVNITSKFIKGYMCCTFDSRGILDGDTLRIPLGPDRENVSMLIYPIKDGMEIWCDNYEDRHELMWFCCGGGTLMGDYLRE